MTLTKDDFVDILLSESLLSVKELDLLAIVYSAEACSATAPQITKAFGYAHFVTVNGMVGRMGKKIAEYKGTPLRRRADQSEAGWDVIFDGHNSPHGFVWTLKEALKQAMDELQLDVDVLPADDIAHHSLPLFEGGRKRIEVNAYERNRVARQLCIQHYGPTCHVCSFDFEKRYGTIGKDYIHVHHIIPISSINSTYKIDPIADMVPVCPNCHAMLHRRPETFSIDELKNIISKQNS